MCMMVMMLAETSICCVRVLRIEFKLFFPSSFLVMHTATGNGSKSWVLTWETQTVISYFLFLKILWQCPDICIFIVYILLFLWFSSKIDIHMKSMF